MKNEMATKISKIWEKILDHDEFTTQDDFFDVGGHSLVATELMVEIEKELGVSLPVEIIFEYPTIDQMVDYIEMRKAA